MAYDMTAGRAAASADVLGLNPRQMHPTRRASICRIFGASSHASVNPASSIGPPASLSIFSVTLMTCLIVTPSRPAELAGQECKSGFEGH